MEKVSDVLDFLPYILKMPSNRIWIDYDDEADVLYNETNGVNSLLLTNIYMEQLSDSLKQSIPLPIFLMPV